MNKPDKAGEPSIEEILASIRRKSSEAPAASQSAGDGAPVAAPSDNPFGASVPSPRGAPPALLDRLNGMTGGDAATGSSDAQAGASNGAKRPMSFDQDLADMFDEPASPAAPKSEMRATPDLGSFTAQPLPATEGANVPAPAAAPPVFGTPSPRVAPSPFGSGFGGADAAAQAPKPPAYGFPPLTKRGGFYPRSEPQLPPMPATGAGDAAASSPASPSLSANQDSGASDASGDSARISDLGSLVPAAGTGHGVHSPRSSFGSPPLGGSGTDTLSRDPLAPNGAGLNGMSMNGAGRVLPELDAKSHVAPVPSATPSGFVTPSLKMPGAGPAPTSAPTSSTTPAAPSAPSANPFAASPSLERAPAAEAPKPLIADKDLSLASTSETAATQALDALALGLAASQAKPEPRLAAPSLKVPSADAPSFSAPSPDASSRAPVKPVSDGAAADAPAPAAVSAAPVSASASRTFEDVVSDMLRPMLQKWVQENMPRIMEKALRSEMQRTLGPGGKPPGSAS